MKMNKQGVNATTLKAVGACLLSATMSMSLFSAPVFAQTSQVSNPSDVEKTETVYATLNDDGSVSNAVVSSWLHDGNGIHNVQEQLNLTNVENIKTNDKIQKNGNTYTWNSDGDDVYYQGDSTKALPVQVAITYYMDGQEYSAKEMKGKSGHMKINVHFTNTVSKTTSSGVIVHPGYLAGGLLRLDNGNYSNVTCSSGKVINDGSNQVLAFASVPGLAETLNSAGLQKLTEKVQASDDCTIEADVKDFDESNLMIGMSSDFDLNDLVETGNIPDLAGSVNQIVDAANQLQDGSEQLYDGTQQLISQSAPLTSASGSVREMSQAFTTLNKGAQTMASGVKDYTQGVDLLAIGSQQLSGITDGITTVHKASQTSLLEGATALNAGLKQLKDSTDNMDPNQLAGLQTQLDSAKETLTAMQGTLTKDTKTLEGLGTALQSASSQLEALEKDQTLSNQIAQLGKDVAALNETIKSDNSTIDANNAALQTKVNDINSQIDAINSAINTQVTSAQANINNAYSSANAALNNAEAATEDADAKAGIESAKAALGSAPQISAPAALQHISVDNLKSLDSLDGSQVVSDAKAIQGTLKTLGGSLATMQKSLGQAQDTMKGLNDDINTSIKTLNGMSEMLNNVASSSDYKDLSKQMATLKAASSQLYAGSSDLLDGVNTLNSGLAQLQTQSSAGIQQVQQGAKQLSSNSLMLNSGASQLSDGTNQLASQSGTVNQMADGLDQLSSAFTQLNDGAAQLAQGHEQFNAQAMQPLKEMADLTESEVSSLTDVFNQIKELTEENDNFAGKPEGATSKVNYVMHTGE